MSFNFQSRATRLIRSIEQLLELIKSNPGAYSMNEYSELKYVVDQLIEIRYITSKAKTVSTCMYNDVSIFDAIVHLKQSIYAYHTTARDLCSIVSNGDISRVYRDFESLISDFKLYD